ncbi:MAG: head GIN domain-containing protein [Bacteroidales bacterium]
MRKIRINRLVNLTAILIIFLTFESGCTYGFGSIKGNGNVIKQERELSSFSGLDIGGAFKVFLAQGDREFVIVEADENLLEVISTEIRGGTLVIKTTEDIRDSEALNIYLTFKNLEEMDISGACKLISEGKLKFGDLEMEFSGASDIDLKFSANTVELDCSGASQIEFYGSAESVELDLSGASHFDAFDFEVNSFEVDVSGASHAKVFATKELSAEVSGAASVKYKGDPNITNFDVSGAASLKKY